MRRRSASALISFSNSPRFSAPIRPLSLITTSPFAALVIFSIHPLQILITETSFTHTCDGKQSANVKQLKIGAFAGAKIVNVHKFAKLRKYVFRHSFAGKY